MKVFFRVGDRTRMGEVVKSNSKTVWVRMMKGARTYNLIKRHIVKHNVREGV